MSIADEIQKLVDLFQQGMLSSEEFEVARARLLEAEKQSSLKGGTERIGSKEAVTPEPRGTPAAEKDLASKDLRAMAVKQVKKDGDTAESYTQATKLAFEGLPDSQGFPPRAPLIRQYNHAVTAIIMLSVATIVCGCLLVFKGMNFERDSYLLKYYLEETSYQAIWRGGAVLVGSLWLYMMHRLYEVYACHPGEFLSLRRLFMLLFALVPALFVAAAGFQSFNDQEVRLENYGAWSDLYEALYAGWTTKDVLAIVSGAFSPLLSCLLAIPLLASARKVIGQYTFPMESLWATEIQVEEWDRQRLDFLPRNSIWEGKELWIDEDEL